MNNNGNLKLKKSIKNFINRVLLTTIIFLIGLILCKKDIEIKEFINKHIYTDSLKFTEVKKLYTKYFGKYMNIKEETESVFTEKISYKNDSIYKDGVKLTVDENYLVPVITSGIVIFIGEKEDYGKTIIVEGIDGVNIWYCNIDFKDIKMYDYIEKGSLIGEAKDNKIYLLFEKDGKFLNYKEYI